MNDLEVGKAASRQQRKLNLDNVHSRTGFGGIVDTSSSYFQQNMYNMYTQQVGYV